MKKIISIALAAFLVLPLLSFFGVSAYETDSQGLKYALSDDYTYYYVQSCSKSATDVNIASEINGLPVAAIYDYAFSSRSSLKSVIIPDTVTKIGTQAFDGCRSLETIEIPDSVNEIGEQAFTDCTSLKNIKIPDAVTIIPRSAFYGCKSLTEVILGDSVTEIVSYAFYNCTSLKNITLSDSVTKIGTDAFKGCENLECTVYDNGKYLGTEANPYFALYNTTSDDITSCVIHNETKIIVGRAFSDCRNLSNITIPASVNSIGFESFYMCTSLSNVVIEDSVKEIQNYAFHYCLALTNVTIPDSVMSIGTDAFYNCKNLQYNVYDNGKYLGNSNNPYHALVGVTSKDISSCVIHENTKVISDFVFYDCYSLEEIEIPDSVVTIGEDSFFSCSGLKKIKLSNSLTKIGKRRF